MRPLILAITASFSPREAADALSFLVALGVRLIIASSTRSGSVEQSLATSAFQVFRREIETAEKPKRQLAAITPGDRQFREAFVIARVSNARLARYYLRSLEMAAKGEPHPWFIPQTDRNVINLEHVLPIKPEENWPDWTDEEVKLSTKRLGNLVLVRAIDNSNLKSSAFPDRRAAYEQSPYVLTSQVALVDEWTPGVIADRQGHLADFAVRTWPG